VSHSVGIQGNQSVSPEDLSLQVMLLGRKRSVCRSWFIINFYKAIEFSGLVEIVAFPF